MDELMVALEESARRGLPAMTLWCVEGMEGHAQELLQA